MMNRHEIQAIYNQGVDAVVDFVEQLFPLIQEQQSQLQEQGLLIQSLTARVEELEQRLAQHSRNSHQPPASDPFNKQTRSLHESSGRQPGAQPGHKRKTLKQVATPDKVILHLPAACTVCGSPLQQSSPQLAPEKRQVFEIPLMRLEVTEHQLGMKKCPCCHLENRAEFPSSVTNPAHDGANIKALALFLHKEQLLPSGRTCEILQALFHQPFSEGTLWNVVTDCAAELIEIEHLIKEAATQSAHANFDETGIYIENRRDWLHVAATDITVCACIGTNKANKHRVEINVFSVNANANRNKFTLYSPHRKRGKVALETIGILPQFLERRHMIATALTLAMRIVSIRCATPTICVN